MYSLFLKAPFPTDKYVFYFYFWHSSIFLYFWTCTIMASSCRSKVELHLFSYVGAVIQKPPRHLFRVAARRLPRCSLFTEVGRTRDRETERQRERGRGSQGRFEHRNRGRAKKSMSSSVFLFTLLGEGKEGGRLRLRLRQWWREDEWWHWRTP